MCHHTERRDADESYAETEREQQKYGWSQEAPEEDQGKTSVQGGCEQARLVR